MVTPTRRPTRSLAQKAYALIKEDVLMARLRPGEMILGTRLAEKYRMSRTPVHEALKLLVREGLLDVIPRVGYRVAELSINDTLEVFQLRLAVEALAAELACDRVTSADIEQLEEMQRRVREKARTLAGDDAATLRYAIQANEEFHLALARLSGNSRLVDVIGGLLDASRRLLLLDPRIRGYIELDPGEHRDVLEALAAGDKDAARARMASHVREGQTRVMQRLMGQRLAGPDRPAAATVRRHAKAGGR